MSKAARAPVGAVARTAIGVFGGTFDPVHNAHLTLARLAREALGLSRLLWLPTGQPPYRSAPLAAATHRVAMLRLALADAPGNEIDTRELDPAHSGYTVDSLERLREGLDAGSDLVLLIGADQYAKLGTWHRAADLPRLARLAVFARPGVPLAPAAGIEIVAMTPLAISSSDIRARLARGEDVSALLPPAVLLYIQQQGLYR